MKKTVFISGAFNVVHPGHLRLFKFAKELGKKLIVIVLKLGSEGIIIQTENKKINGCFKTNRLPSLNSIPRDVAGAGDSLLAGCSLYLAVGGNIWEASIVGSYLASIQISRMGNIPINIGDLLSKIR